MVDSPFSLDHPLFSLLRLKDYLTLMGLVLLIFLRVFFLLVIEGGSLLPPSTPRGEISLGSSLNPHTNPSWLSPSGLFAFGFYRQDDDFAVGVWLQSRPEITVVWTANRDDPPVSSNSTIELTEDGLLVLHTTQGEEKNITSDDYWGSATSASMLDSGNFVLYNSSSVIWESFEYPCDTILVGQKLYRDDYLVSSVSASQHSSGRYVLEMQNDGNLVAYPQYRYGWAEFSYWSTGTFFKDDVSLILDRTGSLYLQGVGVEHRLFDLPKSSRSKKSATVIFRATLDPDGNFVLYSHIFTSPSSNMTRMRTEWKALQNLCKVRGVCGVNSYCSNTGTGYGDNECRCFPGFLFINNTRSGKFLGCYRNFTDEEACSQGELKLVYNITALDNVEVGDFPYSVMDLSKEACRKSCLYDCNCWASVYANRSCKLVKVPISYALLNKNISDTVFIKTSFPNDQVKDPHRPLPALMNREPSVVAERKKLVSILAITLGFVALMCTMIAFSSFFLYRVHAHRYQSISESVDLGLIRYHFSLRSFTYDELQKATDGFKEVIGKNDFGEVYKGLISEEKKVVAVKRLEMMFQGAGGFGAEITAIAQTHHRNLVRLLGFCTQGATKLLVYEFMSNGSLAEFLFNAEKPPGWKERVRVALDVARGILYLHEECEARIIHCNIEPHNIFFDESWTAKISDFGLSKLLRLNQSGTLTGIRGTRGYQAPEWYRNTLISTKVDIYSFGVVLLEILCCTGDREIDVSSDDKRPLFTWVYNCFIAKELPRLTGVEEEVDIHMFEKMVKVGLLCIQDDPDARPSIKNVILMLEGTTDVPNPPSPTPLI